MARAAPNSKGKPQMGEALDRGYAGEQHMGFWLGENGYVIVDGPSGKGGHAANAPGFDGLAFNPQTNEIILYDNKAYYAKPGTSVDTRSGKTIDPTAGLAASLQRQIARVNAIGDMPGKQRVLGDLRATLAAVAQGRRWPSNVRIAITNAWSRRTGISATLRARGIEPIDVNRAPRQLVVRPPSRARLSPSVRAVAASAIAIAVQVILTWLLGKYMERELQKEIRAKLDKVQDEAERKMDDRMAIQLAGEMPFANISLTIGTAESWDALAQSWMPSIPVVRATLDGISATPLYRHVNESTKLEAHGGWLSGDSTRTELKKDSEVITRESHSTGVGSGIKNHDTTHRWSIEAPAFSKAEMEWFDQLTSAYMSGWRKLGDNPTDRALLESVRQ